MTKEYSIGEIVDVFLEDLNEYYTGKIIGYNAFFYDYTVAFPSLGNRNISEWQMTGIHWWSNE